MRWNSTENVTSRSSSRLKLPMPPSTYTANSATHTRMLPATRYSISFIAPYSLGRRKLPKSLLLPHTPMSRYIGITASS